MTLSSLVATIAIWSLLLAGTFFGGRSWWRRRSAQQRLHREKKRP